MPVSSEYAPPVTLVYLTETDIRKALLSATEKLLDEWKHPEPYIPPHAPGGKLLLLENRCWADSNMLFQERATNETCLRRISIVSPVQSRIIWRSLILYEAPRPEKF